VPGEGRGDPDRARRHHAPPHGGYRPAKRPRNWEDLAARALAIQPPYRPIPGTAVYHLCVDGSIIQVGKCDLQGPLRDLVIVVLAIGSTMLAAPSPLTFFTEPQAPTVRAWEVRRCRYGSLPPAAPMAWGCCPGMVGA
jgi:hypothetical protein